MNETRTRLPAALLKALNTSEEDPHSEKSSEVKLTLKELVKAANELSQAYPIVDLDGKVRGVTERTIRYYIQEGVLPPPQGAGPSSYYSLEHLTRLSLVWRFKAALLPLSQIKQLMSELSLAELEQIANQFHSELAQTYPVLGAAKKRMEQGRVAPVLNPVSNPEMDDLEVFQPPDDTNLGQSADEVEAGLLDAPAQIAGLNFAGRWNRIALAPGLELHYQEGGPQDSGVGRERLARLVELAMRLYR